MSTLPLSLSGTQNDALIKVLHTVYDVVMEIQRVLGSKRTSCKPLNYQVTTDAFTHFKIQVIQC